MSAIWPLHVFALLMLGCGSPEAADADEAPPEGGADHEPAADPQGPADSGRPADPDPDPAPEIDALDAGAPEMTDAPPVEYPVPGAPDVWQLEVADEDLERILNDVYVDVFVPCRLAVGELQYDEGCRLRLRGGSSRDFPKKSFRITYPEDAPHPGFTRKINLRAEYNDPSFLRNVLAHIVFARLARLPVPRVRFVQLVLNGAPYGLMTEVERVGPSMASRAGLDPLGPTYEADAPLELLRAGAGSLVPLDNEARYQEAFRKVLGAPEDFSDLRALIEDGVWQDQLDAEASGAESSPRVREAADIARIRDYLAVMALLQSEDHVRKNYFLTRGARGWFFHPWDLELTFGCLWNETHQSTLCDAPILDRTPYVGQLPEEQAAGYPVEAFYNLLIHRVFADAQLRAAFDARVCEWAASTHWVEEVPRLVDALEASIAAAAIDDPQDRNVDEAAFRRAVAEVRRFPAERSRHLRRTLGCP